MKNLFVSAAAATLVAASLQTAHAQAAKPRQFVVVVAEGLSPSVIDLGKSYLRKADDEPDATTSFDSLMTSGKPATVGTDAVGQMKGLLETAKANGFKTGLVTTGDVSQVAPLFYNVSGDTADQKAASVMQNSSWDFLAGGGRAHFYQKAPEDGTQLAGRNLTKEFVATGNSLLLNEDAFDAEVKGRALALQSDNDLSFSLDRQPETEAGLTEISSLAIDTLSANNAPFVLVIHDTLIKKALDTKDTPALFEQFRDLNSVVADVLGRREDNPQLATAVLMTGGPAAPKFSTTNKGEQDNAFFIVSNLGASFAGVGQALKGADDAKITTFIDPEDGQYRGWKVAPETRAGIIAGTITPEAAVRASYDQFLKLEYGGATAQPGAYAVGFDASGGLTAALQAVVSTAPATAAANPQ